MDDAPFGTLDYVYMSSHDVAADLRYFTDTLGGRRVFAIDDGGTRVAMVTIGEEPPAVLLTDHLRYGRADPGLSRHRLRSASGDATPTRCRRVESRAADGASILVAERQAASESRSMSRRVPKS